MTQKVSIKLLRMPPDVNGDSLSFINQFQIIKGKIRNDLDEEDKFSVRRHPCLTMS